MTQIDWRASEAQRAALTKRAELEALTRLIEHLDVVHAEALAADGEHRARLRTIANRLCEIGPMFSVATMAATRFPSPEDLAETKALEDERAAVEREWQAALAARTTTWSNGLKTGSYCTLSPIDVAARRTAVCRARDGLADELAGLEAQLSAGERLATGEPASEYVEYRARVEALRQRIG